MANDCGSSKLSWKDKKRVMAFSEQGIIKQKEVARSFVF